MPAISRRSLLRHSALLLAATSLSGALSSHAIAAEGHAEPQRGGTLVVMTAVQPPQLVPFSPDGSRSIGPKIVEGLLRYDFDRKRPPHRT